MNGTINIEELRKEIEEDRKNLTEKEAAYEAMLMYLNKKEGKLPELVKRRVLIKQSSNVSLGSLRLDVQSVIPQFKGKEFTRADIEDALRNKGIKMDFPTSRITTELIKMEENEVNCVYRGTGRALSRYKAN